MLAFVITHGHEDHHGALPFVLKQLNRPVYGSRFTLQGLDAAAVAVLIGGGAALGWAGAYVAATWHLRRIEPSGEH